MSVHIIVYGVLIVLVVFGLVALIAIPITLSDDRDATSVKEIIKSSYDGIAEVIRAFRRPKQDE